MDNNAIKEESMKFIKIGFTKTELEEIELNAKVRQISLETFIKCEHHKFIDSI